MHRGLHLHGVMFRLIKHTSIFTFITGITGGQVLAKLVEVLRYEPEGRGFDSRWCH